MRASTVLGNERSDTSAQQTSLAHSEPRTAVMLTSCHLRTRPAQSVDDVGDAVQQQVRGPRTLHT